MKKTSVGISSVLSSPDSISGLSYQKAALSISTRSRTTSQSSFARPRRWAFPPAEPHDPAAGPPDVPEQQLDHGRRPDDLDALRVLRPSDGVDEGPRLFRPRALAERACDLEEVLRRAAARTRDELRRVAGVVAP